MKLKLLLFQLFVMVGVFAYAQNDTIKTLLITEAHLGDIRRNYLEITNMGTETVDLSMFEIGQTTTNDYLGSGWMFPAGLMLAPGESYFIGIYHDFVVVLHLKAKLIDHPYQALNINEVYHQS